MPKNGQVLANGIRLSRHMFGRDITWEAWSPAQYVAHYDLNTNNSWTTPLIKGEPISDPNCSFQEWVEKLKALSPKDVDGCVYA